MSYTVCLDAGHGGKDPGACANNLQEKVMNLNTALGAKTELEAHGIKVIMTRTTDVFIGLSQRAKIANTAKADLFVSVHHNAGGADRGECIYSVHETSTGLGRKMAENFKKEFETLGQSVNIYSKKGTSGDYFAVIRESNMPSVICEICFVDNAKDVQIADTVEEQKRNGKLIANAILKTLGVTSSSQPQKAASAPSKSAYFNIEAESSIARSAAKLAAEQIGKPYVWGTQGPNSFDCSGLIDYCFRKAGYLGFSSRETTKTLAKAGKKINSFKDLQSGDIILPQPTHVVMYVGSGFTVEAECDKTGVVKKLLSKLDESKCQIRRLTARDGLDFCAGYFNKVVKITASTLNIRATRSGVAEVLGAYKKDELITVGNINSSADGSLWGSVTYNGKIGYINMNYVSMI